MSDYTLKIIVEGVDKASGPLNTIGGSLQRVGEIAAGVSLANMFTSIASGLQSVAGQALQSYAQFERLGMSINALAAREALQAGRASSMQQALSSTSGQAKELVNWIEKLAIQSPFGESDVANTFRLAMAMGFTTKEAQRTTQALLDFSAATGADSDKMVQLGQALGKIKTTGKISGEEIRQLSEAGLNATQILADTFGKTPQEISKMVSAGQVDADKAINAITASLEKFYGGAGKAQANSFSGILESLQQIQEMTGRDFFAPMFQGLQPYLAELTGALSSDTFRALVEKLGAMAGAGLAAAMATIVKGAQDVATTIQPLLDAQSPAWLTTLTGLFVAADGENNIAVWIEPKVKDGGGVTYDIGSGQFTFDLKGNLQALDLQGWFGGLTTTHWDPATGLQVDMHGHLLGIEGLSVEDVNKWLSDTNNQISGQLTAAVTLTAEWGAGVLQGLWTQIQSFFTSNPFNIFTTASSGTAAAYDTPYGSQMRDRNNLVNEMIRPGGGLGYASGGSVHSGWAWVGERGAELINVGPNGVQVFSNEQSRMLAAGNVPGYADGSGAGDFGRGLNKLIDTIARAVGASSGPIYGPKTLGETGWVDFTKRGTQAMQQAAESTAKAFEVSAKKVAEVFKGALGSVPGLNGLSQVTDLDMQKAKAGMKVSYADDYIRQLSDEVLNKKEWGANIDIKDAAKRAGIDPNLPNELILELVKQAWADKSFFANPANLGLINKDAVQADMEGQQKQARGSANLLGYFGLDNTADATQAAALGQAIQGAFGAIPVEILSSTGQTMMLHLSTGFTDPTTNVTAITNLGGALVTAMGTEAGAAAIKVSGVTLADAQYAAYAGRMGELPPVPPTGTTTPPAGGTTTPPGKAAGGYARGWTVVGEFGPELVNFGSGAQVYSNGESSRMLGGANVTNVYNTFTVNSKLQAEITARKAVDMMRRRSR